MKKSIMQKRPSFTQVHSGFSRVFRIPSNKKEKNKLEKAIELSQYIDKDGRLKRITIKYSEIEQDPFILRVFLFLLAKLSVNKNNTSYIKKLNAMDKSNKDIIENLGYSVEPYEESELTTLLKIEMNYKELAEWIGVNYYDNKAKNRLKKLLEKIQVSAIEIIIKDLRSNQEKSKI